VLAPGGRLVTLDMVPQVEQAKRSRWAQWISEVGFHFWQIAGENLYDREVYAHKLAAIGFRPVEVRSVYEDTMLPFARYSLEQLAKPEVRGRLNPAVARMIELPSRSMADNPWGLVAMDYILAIADKPK
jgi:hypothetical protein